VIGLASDGAPLRALVGDEEKRAATDRLLVLLIGRSEENVAAALASAWHAIRARMAFDGELVDVCTGTGKQGSLPA